MAGIHKLSAKAVEHICRAKRVGKHADGGGLFLQVTEAGGCYWRYKYRLGGKERLYAIGTLNDFTLAEARVAHADARKCVQAGDDPVEMRSKGKADKEAAREATRTFQEVAQEWYDAMIPASASASTKDRAQRAIRNFNAVFGRKAVGDVTVGDLAKVLSKHEKAAKFATRERDQLTAIKIAGYCVGRGYLKSNPFRDIKYTDAFTAPSAAHNPRPAITEPVPFGKLLRDVDGDGDIVNRHAFRLLTLTAVRPGELVLSEWKHIDWQERKMIIPAAVLKMANKRKKSRDKRAGKDLEVPLSRQSVAELRALHKITGAGTHLFPARRSSRRHPHMQRAAINNALIRLGYAGIHCGHGFRSSFSTTMNAERVAVEGRKVLRWPYQDALIELQLDHNDASTQAIYDRGGQWEDRAELMQAWADKIDELRDMRPKLRVAA